MNNSKIENDTLFDNVDSIKQRVENLLSELPHLRDDDNKLIANMWFHQIGSKQIGEMSAFEFLKTFAYNQLTSPETIRRIRQKLQEQKPELRGLTYKKRHELAESVRIQIQNI